MPRQTVHTDQALGLRQLALLYCSSAEKMPYTVTITSGKGGVGKSTIALNLALTLGEAGKKVLLLDADSNLGNLDIMLGISPEFRFDEVLRRKRNVEEALIRPRPNVSILAGSSGEIDYPHMSDSDQRRMIANLKSVEEDHELLLIDTAPGLTQEVVGYALQSDLMLVVITPEPTAIMDAYAMMKIVASSGSRAEMGIVVNAARTPLEAEEAAGKLQLAVNHFLKRSVPSLATIPFDLSIHEAVLEQKPVIERSPASPASQSFRILAQRLYDGIPADARNRAAL